LKKNNLLPTKYILHRGFRGMPSASLAGKVLIGG